MDRDVRDVAEFGNAPRFGTVGQVAVRKQDHRDHIFYGDAAGFDGGPEAIPRSGRGDYGDGGFGVAAEHGLQQIGLLGFGGQAGGRAAALHVDDDERDFDGDSQAQGFGFQRHAGAGGGGERESARVGCADRGGDGGDFVFGLEGHHAEIFVLREFVKNV